VNSKNLLLLACSTLVALLLAEGGLRLAGFQPCLLKEYANREKITQFHPQRGWDLKEGRFLRPRYSAQQPDIVHTHLPGKLRRSRPLQDGTLNAQPKLVMIGGSYTAGNAISDDETFSWKLQERFPDLEVLNYAVGGYGTLQSLLKLQEVLPAIRPRKLVIYGLIAHHRVRNVATPGWISMLSRYNRNDLYIPYVKTGENSRIQLQPLLHFSPFPQREHSALVALLENAWISIRWRKHNAEPTGQITLALVSGMQKLVKRHNADFLVVLLSVNEKAAAVFMKAFSENGIRALNCSFPLTRDMIVTGDGHPNGRMNSKWADCIGRYLDNHRGRLAALQAHTATPALADQ